MHGAAITLAERLLASNYQPDLIVATDMLDTAVFLSLIRSVHNRVPLIVYMHENQITYPWSPADPDGSLERDRHYGFINYTSALAASEVWFNSAYHMDSFLHALPSFLGVFPDHRNVATISRITDKSRVVPLGLDLKAMDHHKRAPIDRPKRAVLLWNHRWEYDKGPEEWYLQLLQLRNRGLQFHLIVLGQQYAQYPPIFDRLQDEFASDILQWGYVESRDEYLHWLCRADILPVTSRHDFFGASVVEAMYANVIPVLPFRLAYPSHIPAKLHAAYFYKHEKEGLDFLHRQILNIKLLRKQRTDQFVQQYDWTVQAPRYDDLADAVVHR